MGHAQNHHGPQAQQHSFNCPYQLASPTKWPEADTADDADVYEVEMLPGDVIVLGSDGLFDNMWNFELEAIISEHLKVGIHSVLYLHFLSRRSSVLPNGPLQLSFLVQGPVATHIWSYICYGVQL